MDPITIIVAALVAGAAAGLKPTAEQAVKDAYAGLKTLVQRKYTAVAHSVDQLESAPDSKARRNVVEEDLNKTEAAQDTELLQQAQALLDTVKTHDHEAARVVGVSLKDIEAAALRLKKILAQGTDAVVGVEVEGATITGDIEISGVQAIGSSTSGPSPRSVSTAEPVKIKILFLAANPTNTTRLRLDEEVRGIDQALRMARYHDAFDLEQQWAVRVTDLQGLLLRHQPDIVHFSGHGSALGEIMIEDATGQVHAVTTGALSTTFSLLKDNIRCVVLNACFSQTQAQAIAEHIDCVVGMSVVIGDRAAIDFAAAFYQALAYGRNVQTAFELGCNQIDLQNLDEQDTPQLIASKANPAQIQFVTSLSED